jgi:ribosome maturation factor RimP
VSRVTSVLLDQHDPISGAYTLEVSSPGLARPLVKFKDFIRFQGHHVVVKTHQLIEGRKTFVGQLVGTNEKDMTIDVALAGAEEILNIAIPFADIKSARLHVDFDNLS